MPSGTGPCGTGPPVWRQSLKRCGLPHLADAGTHPVRAARREASWPHRRRPTRPTRTNPASTTAPARPEAILDVLTDPDALLRWAPVDFDVEHLDGPRLAEGGSARVSGRLAGREVGFDVEVHQADVDGLALSAHGPVALDVAAPPARAARSPPR